MQYVQGKNQSCHYSCDCYPSIFTLTMMKINTSITIHHQIHSHKTTVECLKHHEPSNEISPEPLSTPRCCSQTQQRIKKKSFQLGHAQHFVVPYKKNNKEQCTDKKRSDQTVWTLLNWHICLEDIFCLQRKNRATCWMIY